MPATAWLQPGRRAIGKALVGALLGGIALLGSFTAVWAHNPGGRVMADNAAVFSKLSGWSDDAQSEALSAFRRSCPRAGRGRATKMARALRAVCTEVAKLPAMIDDTHARRFFEAHFEPVMIARGKRAGLFTGYFEPELEAALQPSKDFSVPLRAPPKNLVSLARVASRQGLPANLTHALKVKGKLKAAPTRAQIEAGALDKSAPPVAWLASPVDAFFLHVQGSGRLRFADGRQMRVTYAGKNGHPYTSIGKVLVDHGEIDKARVSMQSIRAWMDQNPDKAGTLMARNRSYIFFNLTDVDNPELGPPGQMGVALTPGRSLAIDLAHHMPGLPIWLDTMVPGENGGADQRFARLMVAQDTGSAIKGAQRGDIFFGTGAPAGQRAGRMQAPGVMIVLQPKAKF